MPAAVALLIIVTASQAWADFQAGLEAYQRGDYAAALKEWVPLAEQGAAEAQFMVGVMYKKGQGVPQNHREAVRWLRLAAEQEFPYAWAVLGHQYYFGRGVKQDYKEAARSYRLAAEQGDTMAQTQLGLSYVLGLGVPEDYVLAYVWCNLGATGGHEAARTCRDLAKEQMPPAQIAEAQRLTREWKPKQ